MRMYHWWKCEGCGQTTPRKEEAPPQRCAKCLQNTTHAYLGHASIVPDALKEQPQPVKPSNKTAAPPTPASITVIVEGGRVKNIEGLLGRPDILVEVCYYDVKHFDKDSVVKDSKGRACVEQHWRGGGPNIEVGYRFRVNVENGEAKVGMSPNCHECYVKTYANKSSEPEVKRWTPPKRK